MTVAKWITVDKLIHILQEFPDPDKLGVEGNPVGNLLISDEKGYIGFIELLEGHGEYFSLEDKDGANSNADSPHTTC